MQSHDILMQRSGEYNYIKCLSCGSIYQSPVPSQEILLSYYQPDYPVHVSKKQGFQKQMMIGARYGYIKKRRIVEKYIKKGSILDVGCARGDFLVEMKTAGWSVIGLEPISSAAQAAKAKGLDILQTTLDEIDISFQQFDVVTLWDVLEHVPDPYSILRIIHKILKPYGIAIFSTPNASSMDARIFGQYWIGYDPPRHVCIFTRKSLTNALQLAGFRIIQSLNLSGTQSYFQTSLDIMVRRVLGPKIGDSLMFALASIPGRILTALPFYVYGLARMGTTLTVVVCKS